jgi:hypothetical protein
MNTNELIEQLDQRYGNPYMAKEYALIQEAIKQLRILSEEVHHLYAQNSGANK